MGSPYPFFLQAMLTGDNCNRLLLLQSLIDIPPYVSLSSGFPKGIYFLEHPTVCYIRLVPAQ